MATSAPGDEELAGIILFQVTVCVVDLPMFVVVVFVHVVVAAAVVAFWFFVCLPVVLWALMNELHMRLNCVLCVI